MACAATGCYRDPLERDLTSLTHFGEQPHDRALVLDLMFGDGAPDGQRIEDLPDGLWVVVFEDVLDVIADRGDRRLGAALAFRFYVLRYIRSAMAIMTIAIEAIAAGGYIVHVAIPFAGLAQQRVPGFLSRAAGSFEW